MSAVRLFAISTLIVAAAYVGWSAFAPARSPDRVQLSRDGSHAPVELRVGTVGLRVPPVYLRRREDIVGGPTGELQLALDVRAFGPPPPVSALPPDEEEAMADVVYLTLTPPDPAIEPAERMARLYGRFLESDIAAAEGGLEWRRFEPVSPYEGEDLFFNPPEGRLFAARCLRTTRGPPGRCIADLRIAGLDVRAVFARRHLAQWERLVAGVGERVGAMVR